MLIERLTAFVWTCALELPVYAWWLHRFVPGQKPWSVVATILALQLTTQPALWQYSLQLHGDRSALWLAEGIVCLVEAALLWLIVRYALRQRFGVVTALLSAVTANAFSWGVGTWLNRYAFQ